jgi:hypothetical protein
MSYPYPQDRSRDRREKGEEPYRTAREEMGEQEAELRTEAEAFGEEHQRPSDEERIEDMEEEAEARLREVGETIARSHDREART